MTYESERRKLNKIQQRNTEQQGDYRKLLQKKLIIEDDIDKLNPKDHTFKVVRSYTIDWHTPPNEPLLSGNDSNPAESYNSYDINLGRMDIRLLPYIFVSVLWRLRNGENVSVIPFVENLGGHNHFYEIKDTGDENDPIKDVTLHAWLNFSGTEVGDIFEEVEFKFIAEIRVPQEIT